MKLQTILKHIIFAFCSKRKRSNDASSCHKTKKIQLDTSNYPNLIDADNFRNQSTNAINFEYDLSSFLSGIGNPNSSNNKKLTNETGNIGNDDLFEIENFVKQIEPSSTDDFNGLETDISALYSPNSMDDYQNFSIESRLNIDPIDFIQANESGLREDMLTPDPLTGVIQNRKLVCPSFFTKDMSDFISEKQKEWPPLINTSTAIPTSFDLQPKTSKVISIPEERRELESPLEQISSALNFNLSSKKSLNSNLNSSQEIKKSTFIQYLNKENSSIPTSDDSFFKHTQIDIKNKYISTPEIQTAITNTEKLLLIRLVPSFKILSFKCYENREFKKDLRGSINIQRAFRKFFKCYIFGFAQEFFVKEKNETLTYHIQSMSWNCFLRIVIDNFNKFYKKYLEKTIKICVDDFSQYYKDFSKVFDHTDLAELKQNVLFWLEHVLEDERNFKLLELYPELKLIIDKIYENEGDINYFKKINCYLSLIFFKFGTLTQCMKTDQNVINFDRNFLLTDSDVFKLIDLEISFLISLFAFNLFEFGKMEVMFIYKTFLKFIRIKFPLMYEYFEQNELIYGSNSIKQDYFDQIQLKKEMLCNIIIDNKTYNCGYYSIINFSNEFKDTFEEYYKSKRPQDFFNISLTKSNDGIVDLSKAKITAFKSLNITFLKILTLELRDKILNSI